MTGSERTAVVLRLCASCRAEAGPHVSLRALRTAARRQALADGSALEVVRSSCLGSCEPGLSAVLETPAGVVRLSRLVTGRQAAHAVHHADALVAGAVTPPGGATVLSRMQWAEGDEP